MTFTDPLLARIRADTPSCTKLIHLHNSGSSLMPRVVVDAVKRHLDLEAEQGGYEAHADASDSVQAV